MTSASELFHITRRPRFGVGSRHVSNSSISTVDLDPTATDAERSFNRRHHNRRHDVVADGVCDPLRRRLPRQHHHHRSVSAQERDTIRVDEGSGQFSLSNNNINLDNIDGGGNRGRRQIGNDRLPGAVLLARERLLERLRGVSLSANRRSNRASSRSNGNGPIIGDNWDTETLRESLGRDLFNESTYQTDPLSVTQITTSKTRPPGLTQKGLTHLQLEVFTEPALSASHECSICLENYAEGDELVCLPCGHKFHFVCLEPWVRICGDCPYCRREIVVSFN